MQGKMPSAGVCASVSSCSWWYIVQPHPAVITHGCRWEAAGALPNQESDEEVKRRRRFVIGISKKTMIRFLKKTTTKWRLYSAVDASCGWQRWLFANQVLQYVGFSPPQPPPLPSPCRPWHVTPFSFKRALARRRQRGASTLSAPLPAEASPGGVAGAARSRAPFGWTSLAKPELNLRRCEGEE